MPVEEKSHTKVEGRLAERVVAQMERETTTAVSHIPPMALEKRVPDAHMSNVEKTGQVDKLLWLRFCGTTIAKCAALTGLSRDSILRYMKTEAWHRRYEEKKAEFLSRVNEAVTGRLQEVALEALETRLRLMRTAKDKFLRDRIAKDLLQMGLEAAKGARGGGVGEHLMAAVERIRRRKTESGEIIEERVRFTGRAGEAAAKEFAEAAGAAAGAADAPRNSTHPRLDDSEGEVGGAEGVGEDEGGPGSSGN